MGSVRITLNGKEIFTERDETILQVAERNNIFIPALCNDKRLEPYGSCRVCLVKVKRAKTLVPSCTTKVSEGMIIDTEDPEVIEARRLSLTLLISEHYGDCVSPCSLECPAHIDIQGYIALIKAGKYTEAVRLIKEKNPLPLTIGRICPHPCETVCRRNRVDEPIAINHLKRFAADYDSSVPNHYVPERKPKKGKKIAVIGSGPSGLSCAYYLAVKGYDVCIYEKNPQAGGMLRYGIPDYRLPKEILNKEINYIGELGIIIHCNSELGKHFTIDNLRQDGFSAVFLGIGAQKSIDMRIQGEDCRNVIGGIEFLYDIATGKKLDIKGKTVNVVGGGNTAMDAARSSLRLGAKEVTILYRRTKTEMPANDYEIKEAEEEGINFVFLSAPIRISKKNGQLEVECIRMKLGEPDASGRRRPVPIEGSNYMLLTHYLITAIGQRVDVSSINDTNLITSRDNVKVDFQTGITEDSFIYAGGDCVTGAATAIEAIAGGRNAALSIDQYLSTGLKPEPENAEFNISRGELKEIPDDYFALYEKDPRAVMPALSVQQRIKDFSEIEKGLEESNALREAIRCLECGCNEGFSCLLRDYSTRYSISTEEFSGEKIHFPEYNNLIKKHPAILRDENKCIKCGICVRICDEVWGLNIFGYSKRGFETEISPYFGLDLKDTECDLCGQCADACPTGALSLNTYLPKPGPFKVTMREERCIHCSLGCTLNYNIYENIILKTTCEPQVGENDGNLCVRGRFGFGYLLTTTRQTKPLEYINNSSSEVNMGYALQKSADILRKSGKVGILTSTHLSNEEYEKLYEIADIHGSTDVYHLPCDFAENNSETLPVIGKIKKMHHLIKDLKIPDLSDFERSDTIVLFNIFPGRSYPILEMKIRNAARTGTKLFIINDKPTRLDDYAESVFRIKKSVYSEFFHFIGHSNNRNSVQMAPALKEYYKHNGFDSDILFKIIKNKRRIRDFINSITSEANVCFITDEDISTQQELEAYIMALLSLNSNTKLLIMQKGTNPRGAYQYLKTEQKIHSICRGDLQRYESLLFFKLPQLFVPLNKPIIQMGFKPFDNYGMYGLFLPSSSLLETGGSTYLYNGKIIQRRSVLKMEQAIDNINTLSNLKERLLSV